MIKIKTPYQYVGFEILTTVTMRNTAFWDVKSYSPGLFGGICCSM